MEYFTVLTEIGATKIAQATANKTPLKLTKITLGDGNGTVPTPLASQTNLVNEVFSVALSELKQDENNDSYVVATAIIPIEVGNFWIRELGVFDENDNLIAVGNYPETFKSLLAQGAAKEVVIKVTFQVSSAKGVTLLINPSIVMASQEFVNEKLKDKASIDYVDAKPSGFKNLIINGSLDIWQRGENFNLSNNSYIADRFMGFKDVSYIKVKNENYNSIKMNNSEVSDLNSYDALIYYPLILDDTNLKNGDKFTISFLYKGADLDFACFLRDSVMGENVVFQVSLVKLSNSSTFKKASFTFTLEGKTSTHKVLNLRWGSSSHGEFEVAQVQLELGEKETNFEIRPLGLELSLCQRYFCKSYPQNVNPGTAIWSGCLRAVGVDTVVWFNISFPTEMRIQPNCIVYGTDGTKNKFNVDVDGDGYRDPSYEICTRGGNIHGSSTTGHWAWLHYTADAEIY